MKRTLVLMLLMTVVFVGILVARLMEPPRSEAPDQAQDCDPEQFVEIVLEGRSYSYGDKESRPFPEVCLNQPLEIRVSRDADSAPLKLVLSEFRVASLVVDGASKGQHWTWGYGNSQQVDRSSSERIEINSEGKLVGELRFEGREDEAENGHYERGRWVGRESTSKTAPDPVQG